MRIVPLANKWLHQAAYAALQPLVSQDVGLRMEEHTLRIAFVGTSSPLCYAEQITDSNGPSAKEEISPILESPLGLMLMFDEIWFLSRALCPRNMQELGYVRFLDEEGRIPKLEDTLLTEISQLLVEHASYWPHFSALEQLSQHYWSEAVKSIPFPDAYLGPDRQLNSEKLPIFASAVNVGNLVVDLLLMVRLNLILIRM